MRMEVVTVKKSKGASIQASYGSPNASFSLLSSDEMVECKHSCV
jgi:hypothetical protein